MVQKTSKLKNWSKVFSEIRSYTFNYCFCYNIRICRPNLLNVAYSANSSTLAPMIAEFLRIMVLYILPVPVGATAAFVFQGMEKGPTSLVITLIRELILCVLFAYLLGFVLNLGVLGIYIGL